MKMIIDIPDEIYKKYMDDRTHVTDVLHAVRNGKPLPKGHGRLIDADKFHEVIENIPIKDTDKWFNWMQKTCNRLADAPTIIEGSDSE